jgi:hypothetical protein
MKTGKSKFVGYEKIPFSDKFYDFIWRYRFILLILIFGIILILFYATNKILTILATIFGYNLVTWYFKCQRVED